MTNSSRDRIVGVAQGSLEETIYAEAGAGTGKTTALVERIVNLLLSDDVKPENIVAVTFTVAAASELRQRVRESLEEHALGSESKGANSNRLNAALESLDAAYIGTIHSFAQSLLAERPLEAGLPPVFEVNDPVVSDDLFDRAWREWLDTELGSAEFAQAVGDLQRLGIYSPLQTLKSVADQFRSDYDLVESIIPLPAARSSLDPSSALESIQGELKSALSFAEFCTDDTDRMFNHLQLDVEQALAVTNVALGANDYGESVLAVTQMPKLRTSIGKAQNWLETTSGEDSLKQVRASLKSAGELIDTTRQMIAHAALVLVINHIGQMVLDFTDRQRETGSIDFQDLLVLSCKLLDENQGVRSDFQRRYRKILIDEFQDTDPLQLKLAILLSDSTGNGEPDPGTLFVVGDPKQSIYRFRRADLSQLSSLIASLNAERLALSRNFRSHSEILEWVNKIFDPWMSDWQHDPSEPVQASYEPLIPGREIEGTTESGHVLFVGHDQHKYVDDVRQAESQDIARFALDVGSGVFQIPTSDGDTRESSYRDMCVLFPRRTGLAALESALDEHGVPYVLEGQSAIFDNQVIRDLTSALVAIDDPTDQVAVVAALKSIMFACSDQDLYDWANEGHKFGYSQGVASLSDNSNSGVKRVHAAVSKLNEFHHIRHLVSTPQLIEILLADLQIRESILITTGSDQDVRMIDLLLESARSIQSIGTGSVREFVRWVDRQIEEEKTVSDATSAESEVDAVRVMTIHASKGLEFPIVAISGLQVQGTASKANALIKESKGVPELSVTIGARDLGIRTNNYDAMADQDKLAAEAEQVRLAYVAATRARDYLFVSTHRTEKDKKTLAQKIWEMDGRREDIPPTFIPRRESDAGRTTDAGTSTSENQQSDRAAWIDRTSEVIRSSSVRGYTTPSALADHSMFEAPKPEDSSQTREQNNAQRGRAGTSIGSAVHQVLQDVDFADLSNVDQLINSAIAAYSGEATYEDVAPRVQSILNSPTIQKAAGLKTIHEAWVAAEVELGVELEGAVDLLIENEDGTISIIDFKTDRVSGEDLLIRARGYEPQLGGYALILESLGFEVRDAALIFSEGGSDGTALEHVVEDLEDAKRGALAEATDRVNETIQPIQLI